VRGSTRGRKGFESMMPPGGPWTLAPHAGQQRCIGDAGRSPQETERFPLAILIEERKAKLRGVDHPLRQVTRMSLMTVVKRAGVLAGKIRRKHGVRASTVESGPAVCGVRKMEMKEGNRGDPREQPGHDQQTHPHEPVQWTHLTHFLLSTSH